MKTTRIFLVAAIFASLAATSFKARAQGPVFDTYSAVDTTAAGINITDVIMRRAGDDMKISMNMGLQDLKMKGDRVIFFTPVIVGENDTLALTSISLYGRTRWIQYQRNERLPQGIVKENAMQFSHRPASLSYFESVPYEPWMSNSSLEVRRTDYGCCNTELAAEDVPLAQWHQVVYQPVFRYVRPVAAPAKLRELEGQAFIDFPVDQTVIYPEYRRNRHELDSIKATIDVVRNDPDATIQTVWLKGFASPESPYAHNTELAIGRTAALKKYIQDLYDFKGVEILTDYEPEDWEGLRKAVEASNMNHRQEILDLIDSDLEPDPKEWKIKSTYPEEYRFMLTAFYPALRHTNYKVSYIVRSYNDPAEILQVMRTRPTNLDLNEFYIAASALEPGSPEYNEVFETAATVYPNDPVANLNAASALMARGEYFGAARYLSKAGDSAEADYARAVQAILAGRYNEASKWLDSALDKGYTAPAEELDQMRAVLQFNNK